MKKIRILEFDDPFARGTPGLKPVVVSRNRPGASDAPTGPSLRDRISGPPNADPQNLGPVDPETGEKIEDDRPIPSPQAVANMFDVNPNDYEADMVNCLDDFSANWHWYFAYGAFYCWALYPAVRNIITLARATGGAVGSPIKTAQNIVDGSKEALEKVKNIGNRVNPSVPQDGQQKFTDAAQKNLDAKGSRFKDIPEKIKSKIPLLKKYGFPAWRAGRIITSWMFVYALAMNYGPENVRTFLQNLITGKDEPDDKDSIVGGALGANAQASLFADSWIKILMVDLNGNLYKRCAFLNSAIVAVILGLLGAFLTKGRKILYTAENADVFKKLTSGGDEFKALMEAEARFRIDKFLKDYGTEAEKILKTNSIKFNDMEEYINIITTKGSKESLAFLKAKYPNKTPDELSKINKECGKKFNEMDQAFRAQVKTDWDKILANKQDHVAEINQSEKIMDEITLASLRYVKNLTADARISGDLALAIRSSRGKVFDDIRGTFLNQGTRAWRNDAMLDISDGMVKLETSLSNGTMSTRDGIRAYKDGLLKSLDDFAEELVTNSSKLKANDAERIKNLTKSLSDLRTRDDLLEQAIKALLPKGKQDIKVNFVDKIFKTPNLKRAEDIDLLRTQRETVECAMREILKINNKIGPNDLKKIEEAVENTYKSYQKIFDEKYLGVHAATLKQRFGILSTRVLIGGLTVATVLNIVKYTIVKPPAPGTLESFEAENIAKSLAWDGWLPNPTAEDEYQAALDFMIARFLTNLDNTPTNRRLHPNQRAQTVVHTIYIRFIFIRNYNFLKDQLSKGVFNSRQDLNEQKIKNFTEEFIEYKIKDDKIESAFELSFSLGDDPLTNPDKNYWESNIKKNFRQKWRPVVMGILAVNSGIMHLLDRLPDNEEFWEIEDEDKKLLWLEKYLFIDPDNYRFTDKRKVHIQQALRRFQRKYKMYTKTRKKHHQNSKITNERRTTMDSSDLKLLVREMLKENTGMGYGKYPYNSNEYTEGEPDEDYMIEWKALVEAVCGNKKKNLDGDPKTTEDMAVEVAKMFVKDLELFREVLEIAGSNKSLGVAILQRFKEKNTLDKEMNVS